ncbi:MAG: hypothetical protein QXD77_00360 [Candidatus Aenigmatarchaeota archaeon]
MSAILSQIISLMTLLVGILVGEIVAFRAFGKPKPKMLLVDMFVFVVVLTLIYSFVTFTEAGLALYLTNFFIGVISIVSVRGGESLFRMTETPKGEDKIVVNIIRALSRYGLDEDEIKGVLKRSGISPKTVDRLSGLIEENVPAYVPKLVKLETEIADIKSGIDNLAATLNQIRMNDLKHLTVKTAKAKKVKKGK